MSKKKNSGSSKRDFYSDDMTKAVIGNLFAEYAAEDGKNYFVSDNTRTRKSLEDEPEELEQDIDEIEEQDLEAVEEPEVEETEEEYTPRRKRARVRVEEDIEEEPVKKKGLFSIFGNSSEEEEEQEPDFEIPKKSPREIIEDRSEKAKIPKFMQEYTDNDDFDDEEDEDVIELPIGRVAVVVGAVVIVIVIIALAVSRASYKNQLEEALTKNAELEKLTTSSTYESEIAQLQAQVNELTSENERLKNSAVAVSGTQDNEAVNSDNENNENNNNNENNDENKDLDNSDAENTNSDEKINQNSSDEQSYTMYTVKAGDYPFSISEEVYGDGSRYKEILELNGITGDDLVAGMEIKIPN